MTLRIEPGGPFDWPGALRYFGARAIRGVELVDGATYRRVGPDDRIVHLAYDGRSVLAPAGAPAERVRRLLGLDADHATAVEALAGDPLVGPRIRRNPGLRVPGTWDPFETGVRAIIGQQVSVAGASTVTARLVARHGTPVPDACEGLTHRFPTPEVLAATDLGGLGLTGSRIEAIRGFARAVAEGRVVLDRHVPIDELIPSITSLRGLGPWTAHYLALRLGHPDAFPGTDLGLLRAAGTGVKELARLAEGWRPFRALAAVHLWETPA